MAANSRPALTAMPPVCSESGHVVKDHEAEVGLIRFAGTVLLDVRVAQPQHQTFEWTLLNVPMKVKIALVLDVQGRAMEIAAVDAQAVHAKPGHRLEVVASPKTPGILAGAAILVHLHAGVTRIAAPGVLRRSAVAGAGIGRGEKRTAPGKLGLDAPLARVELGAGQQLVAHALLVGVLGAEVQLDL